MTRIIVRNLPDRVTKEKLREIFGEKGTITDMQLKYTKSGKFRKFAFIGYQKQEQAESAIDSLNNTYINMSKIQIEHCRELGDPTKPRSWSKHAPDSSAYRKKKKETDEEGDEPKRKKTDDRKKIKDPKLEELLSEYKNDNMFREFVATQLPNSDEGFLVAEEATGGGGGGDVEADDGTKLADRCISDLEYLKLKTGTELARKDKENAKETKPSKSIKLFTVKMKGLTHRMKKSEIKAFVQAKPFSIRKARGVGDVIFLGFKTEAEMKKALLKNRSFFAGKRIHVRKVKEERNEDEPEVKEKWQKEETRLKEEETIAESGRIFVRNLPYVVAEDEMRALFEKYGPISDMVFPIDSLTRKPKGYCLITFVMPEHAAKAFSELDGTIFQGRMLHLLPGIASEGKAATDEETTNYKKSKLKKDKMNAGLSTNWNTFFVGENALAEAMANAYNTTKENVLGDGANVAVRLALGETQIINQMKEFLEENDVCLESLANASKAARSKRVILVKNLKFGTKAEEIRERFAEFGQLKRVVLPPNGVTAIVEFIEASEARKAFRSVAYSKFKNLPLYLEWAPEKIFKREEPPPATEDVKAEAENEAVSGSESRVRVSPAPDYIPLESCPTEGCTIFVKGLNFSTDDQTLRQHFSRCGRVASASVVRRRDPNNPGKRLSLGYGFVQFATREEAEDALKKLQFSKLDGHVVELKRSNRQTRAEPIAKAGNSSASVGKPSPKILVKNVPFQATQREVQDLFKVFGDIKSVRLPKKMVGTGSHRGFAFVEYNTVHDAKRAFNALSQSTHLYGRRLVLEWAAADDDDVDVMRAKTAERFAGGKKSKKKKINMEEEAEPE